MENKSCWFLDRKIAYASCGAFNLQTDLSRPSEGVILTRNSQTIGSFFGANVEQADRLFDAYCRGQDLIVEYPADQRTAIAGELYWRLIERSPELLALEWIYSLRTSLLDTKPAPIARCQIKAKADQIECTSIRNPNVEALIKDPRRLKPANNFCFFAIESECSLAVGAFPNDLQNLQVQTGGEQTELAFHLKSEFLEKGVIRRHRLCMAIAAGADSHEKIQQVADNFVRSELPLTV